MFTVMRDPVCLPSSKTILDRATIKSHLLSDSKDPFNRAPLTIEEVIPGKKYFGYISTPEYVLLKKICFDKKNFCV